MRALIVEDDPNVAESVAVCLQLRWAGIIADIVDQGLKAVEMVKSEFYDIMVLDINLPDIDGFEVLKRIRRFSKVPTIIVSVRGSEKDRVKGLEMGADDYIVKPFRPRDLVARVNAVLRRSRASHTDDESRLVVRGKMCLNPSNDKVTIEGRTIELSPYESELLQLLIKNEGKTVNSGDILREVWEREYSDSSLIETYVKRLRDKLNDNPPRIIVSKGAGDYQFFSPTS